MSLKAPQNPTPPMCIKKPFETIYHGVTLCDPWHWLRDPGYPQVSDREILDYIIQENTYRDRVTADWRGLEETLFEEIKGRLPNEDESVPWRDGDFYWRWDFAEGDQYRRWHVRAAWGTAEYDLLFDENKAAQPHDYFKLGSLALSPDGSLLAYSTDTNGSERFTVKLKERATGATGATSATGADLSLVVKETSGEIIFDAAGTGFYYVVVSEEWRPYLVRWQSVEGGAPVDIYREEDSRFFVHIRVSAKRDHLFITSATHVTSECHIMPLGTDPHAARDALDCLAPRREGHQYHVSEGAAGFWIRSNRDHVNFGLYLCEIAKGAGQLSSETSWTCVRLGSDTRYISGLQVLEHFLLVEERQEGQEGLLLLDADGQNPAPVKFEEDVRSVSFGVNAHYGARQVRLNYTSMVTPQSVYEYDPEAAKLTCLKEQQVPSGYDKTTYVSERIMVTVRDGVRVPVSLVRPKNWTRGTGAPLHLYGYGAYGLGMAPGFSAARLSLLDRGFAYAIAHIRGGDELGYGWYEAGKLDKRENTFNDFVDVARHLVAEGYAVPAKLTISGGSAGGELMGAVLNQAPDLFGAAVLHVPFVDVLNTMLDESLPLTPMEWPEWGNPIEDKAAFETIRAYCPYSNMVEAAYPPLFVTGGLNDPRVTYWEPLKWTAKMRQMNKSDTLVVMKMNMGAGHGGKSGRFERYREVAEEYAFLIKAVADGQTLG